MSGKERESEVELDLECSLCKDIYREPKTLSCLHSFCLECLETYIERTHSNLELRCPICRTSFNPKSREKDQLSNLSTDSFILDALNVQNSLKNSIPKQQSNHKTICLDEENEATSYCLDCEDYFCEMCAKAHRKTKTTKHHQIIAIEQMKNENQINSITTSSSQIYCQTHQQKEIELFCEDCQLPICSLCIDSHPFHKISTLPRVMENEKQFFTNFINLVKPREKELQGGINKCEEIIKQMEINSTTTQIQINQLFKEIRTKLDEKEQELLDKLDEIEKQKKKELELQKEELKFGIESIIGSCQMIENSLSLSNNPKNNVKLLSMKKLYQSRLDYLLSNIWEIKPCHNPSIKFSISLQVENLYSSISNIGFIDSNEVLFGKCFIPRNKVQKVYEEDQLEEDSAEFDEDEEGILNRDYYHGKERLFEGKISVSKVADFHYFNENDSFYQQQLLQIERGKHNQNSVRFHEVHENEEATPESSENESPDDFEIKDIRQEKERLFW